LGEIENQSLIFAKGVLELKRVEMGGHANAPKFRLDSGMCQPPGTVRR
jgi:hypothetical protein